MAMILAINECQDSHDSIISGGRSSSNANHDLWDHYSFVLDHHLIPITTKLSH